MVGGVVHAAGIICILVYIRAVIVCVFIVVYILMMLCHVMQHFELFHMRILVNHR